MSGTTKSDERMAQYTITQIYPMYLAKVEKKGHSKKELDQVITWLTGFDGPALDQQIESEATFAEFFDAATLNPNAHLIKGLICGHRVEDIKNPLTQKIRYLDKLVDKLARGKKMENILRKGT